MILVSLYAKIRAKNVQKYAGISQNFAGKYLQKGIFVAKKGEFTECG